MAGDLSTINDLLDHLQKADDSQGRVSLRAIMDTFGSRAFGPLLLLAGLVTLAPVIGPIPGVPTIMGTLVLLTAGQLLIGREQFWLPAWVLDRSVEKTKLDKAVGWLRKPAGWFDRLTGPRYSQLTRGAAVHVVAGTCILLSLMLPVMEFVPFSALTVGVALAAFGLALIARDGVLMIIAGLACAGGAGLLVWYFI
jgi:hypothetical protein